ncbi:MAG: hypothetical protein EOO13_08445, partial [Chitinophagaceae bacterium]
MWAVHQLYSTLVEVDANGSLKPLIARSWEFSPDKKSIRFNLRTDIFFHNDAVFANGKGRRIIAEDVRYSLNRIIDAATASPGAWIFNNRVDSLQPFVAINDSTFQVNLLKPFHPILGILSMQYCSVVPKEAVEKYGLDFRRHAVGSGPFQFVAWEEGQALILKKNEHYFERDSAGNTLPYLDGVKVNFYDSKATEFLEFRQGRLDFINDIDPSFKDEVLTKTGNLKKQWEGMIYLNKHPYLNIEYFGILHDSSNALLKNSPLRFKKVRQAINYAINRKKMMLYLRNSIGTAAESGFVPQGLPSFDADKVKGYNYDVERAQRLLTEAGFPAGKGLPEIKLLTIPIYTNLASYVANELKQVGVQPICQSRWLNAVSVRLTPEQYATVANMPFVKAIQAIDPAIVITSIALPANPHMAPVMSQIQAPDFMKAGLTGRFVNIGVIDAGFFGADSANALKHIFARDGVKRVRDYVNEKKTHSDLFRTLESNADFHGTEVLAAIAGNDPSENIQFGLATDATFYLARSDQGNRE